MSSFASGQGPHPGQQYGGANNIGGQNYPSSQGQASHSYSPPLTGGANRFAPNNASVISAAAGGGVYAPNPPAAYPGDIAQTQSMHHSQQPYYEQTQAYRPSAEINPGYAPTLPNAANGGQQGDRYNTQYQGQVQQQHQMAPASQQYHGQQQHASPAPASYAPPPGPPPPPSGPPLSMRQQHQQSPPPSQHYQQPPHAHPPQQQQASPYAYGAQQVSPPPAQMNPGAGMQYGGSPHAQGPAALGASPTYHQPPVSQGTQYQGHPSQSPVAQQQQVHRPYSPLRQQPQPQPQQQMVHRPYSPVQRQHQYSPAHQSPQNQQQQHYGQQQHQQQYSPQPAPMQQAQQMQPPASANYAYSQADPGYYRQEPVQLGSPPSHPPYHPPTQQQPPQFQQQAYQQPGYQTQQPGYQQTPPPMQTQHSSYSGPASSSHQNMQYSAPNSAHTLVSPNNSRPVSHYNAGPLSQQQQHVRQSPSPVPLSQSQMRRENSYRAGHYDGNQQMHGGPSPVRQDGRGGFPEHRTSYVAGGHTPISSVLTAEPILAPAAGLGSASGSIHRPGGNGMQASGYPSTSALPPPQQQPPMVSQNSSMSTLVSSMGSMSMRPSQPTTGVGYGYRQQQQQPPPPQQSQRQSLVMSVPSTGTHPLASQTTLGAGHGPKPPPVSLTQSNYASSSAIPLPPNPIHSAPLLQSAPELPGNTSSPGNSAAYPLWANINAAGFHAYQHHIPVQKSNFSGTKHALIIGINYYNKEYSQTSNINSAHSIRTLLVKRFGYLDKNVVLLSDDQDDPRSHPTHHLITSSIKRMMREVRPNDSVFFYFCGFGRLPVQVLDRRTDAVMAIRKLRSDFILPSDFESTGAVDSAYLKKYLVRQLPQSARLTALFNCIVNDTGLGVPYKYSDPSSGTAMLTNAIAGSNLFEAGLNFNQAPNASFGDLSQRFETSLMQQQQHPHASMTTDAEAEEMSRIRQSSGDIIVFAWDRDYANPKHKNYLSHTPSNQFGAFWGAAMESALRARPRATFGDVLTYLQSSSKKIVMLPFIASGRKIRMDEEFDV
ncbi:Ca(2+)-dependent cysteine protease [Coemansia sp. IMI 203386]|nr:Ca(2+)-dependent cysteine protease [Coemansia sp. IMI 203386]